MDVKPKINRKELVALVDAWLRDALQEILPKDIAQDMEGPKFVDYCKANGITWVNRSSGTSIYIEVFGYGKLQNSLELDFAPHKKKENVHGKN